MKSGKSTDNIKYLIILRTSLIISFVVLGYLAYLYSYFQFDLQFSQWLQRFTSPYFSFFMNLVSEIGDDFYLQIIILFTALTLHFAGLRKESVNSVFLPFIAFISGSLAKGIIFRPRPTLDLVSIHEILLDKSFPSLHVLVFTVFFGYLFYLALTTIKSILIKYFVGSISLILILTIGISRIYLGAHWASDTLGGYLLGALILSFIKNNAKR